MRPAAARETAGEERDRERERERGRTLCTEAGRRNLEYCHGLITELSTLLEAMYRHLFTKRIPGGGRGRNVEGGG